MPLDSVIPHWLKDIHFTDSLAGWVTGGGGVLLQTVDGGKHWENRSITNIGLQAIGFTGSGAGWAAGNGGTILHYGGTGPVGFSPPRSPSRTKELAIYPNPFSGHTSLVYHLTHGTTVTFSIYDMEGRLLLHPLHQWRSAGTHECAMDLTLLPNGIYLGVLTLGETVVTGKMIKSE
jgi:hypothetical protein